MITRELVCLLPLICGLAVQGAVLNYAGYQPLVQQYRGLNSLQGQHQQQQQVQQQPAHQWSYASLGQPATVYQPQATFSAPATAAAPLSQYLQLFNNGMQGSNGAGVAGTAAVYDSSTSGLGSTQPADNILYSVLPATGTVSQTPIVSATAGFSGSDTPLLSGSGSGSVGGGSYLDTMNPLYGGLYSPVVGSSSDALLGTNGGILGAAAGDDTGAAVVDSTGDAQYYLGPSAYQSAATVDGNGVFQITPEAAEQHRQQDERLRQLLIKHFTTSPFHRNNNNNNAQISSIGQFPLVSATGSGTYLQSQQPQQQQQQISIPLSSYL